MVLAAFSQGFVNLDFEAAKIIPIIESPYYPYGIDITNALPGWSVSGLSQGQISYNAPAIGSTWVSLVATNGQQISGNFSVFLQGGVTGPAAIISQTGLVPASAISLLFEGQSNYSSLASLVVTLGGQNLSFSALAIGSNHTLYGAAIPAVLAGQSEELKFSVLEGTANNWGLDNIQFSSSPVPEPCKPALIAIGISLFYLARWKSWQI